MDKRRFQGMFPALFILCAAFAVGGCGAAEELPHPVGSYSPGSLDKEPGQADTAKDMPKGDGNPDSTQEAGFPSEAQAAWGDGTGNCMPGVFSPGRDGENVKAYLSVFSNELADYAESEECCVIADQGFTYGQENWEAFLENTRRGTPDYIILVGFTLEGGAVLNYLEYDGRDYYRMSDSSRDGFSSPDSRYYQETCSFLKVLPYHDWQGNEYQYVFLTDSSNITMTEIEYYWYVTSYYDCLGAVPDVHYLFSNMVKEREEDAPEAELGKPFDKEVTSPEGISVELLYATPVSAGIKLVNDTDLNLGFGEYYDLQILQDGEWYSLACVIDNAAFNAVG